MKLVYFGAEKQST